MVQSGAGRVSTVVSFLNISVSGRYLYELGNDIAIICSGREGQFSLEDTVCAGMLVNIITKTKGDFLALNDAGRSAVQLYRHYTDSLLDMLQESDHGKYLTSSGFAEDLPFCCQVDRFNEVLSYQDGRVVKGAVPIDTPAL
jgi:2-phosphosulfolactate phosphatase